MNLTYVIPTEVPAIIAVVGGILLIAALLQGLKVSRDKNQVVFPRLADKRQIFCVVAGLALLATAVVMWRMSAGTRRNSEPRTTPELTSEASAVTSKYSFEDGPMGWRPQDTAADSHACVRVSRSEETARKEGLYCLKMMMDLVGGDAHKSKGEAWVNLRNDPPAGETIPKNLKGRTVTAWVYAPQGSTGDSNKPNGFQLFVKDRNWLSEYSPWHDVVEGRWVEIKFTVTPSRPEQGWMDEGFNPAEIIAVGIKMGAGEGSTAKYQGPIYVDAVNW